ncbi:MAG: DUF2332 family protein [Betaproteobacteria bacterium]
MDRSRIVRALAGQAAYCEGRSPLYAAVLRELEADAARSPAWLARLEDAWGARCFAVDWEAAHLLLAGMHYAALAGEAGELAALYPSCGAAAGEPRGAARAFLARAPQAFWARLSGAMVQTNEVGRSVAWMVAAAAAFGARRVPFHLVEMGCSAGLNLAGDRLPQACRFSGEPPAGWNRRQPILTRAGLDVHPLRVAEREDRLWLKACVWADDLPRLERLELAIEIFLGMELPIPLEACSFADAPDWLLAHRPARAGEGLLVFNSIGTVYLADEEYARLRRGMARALAPWQERGVWVEYERARERPEGPLELALHRAGAGDLRSEVIASGPPRPDRLTLHAERSLRGGPLAR